MRTLLAILTILTLALPAYAATIHVPDDQPTIQAGIDAASAGDTVLVACGTYDEHDIEMKSGICLRSETGDYECVNINAGFHGRVMSCFNVDESTIIEGISFRNGSIQEIGGESGGGIMLYSSSPTIRNCRVRNCETWSSGGGIYSWGSNPLIENCRIINNQTLERGAGLCCGSATVIGCKFINNRFQYDTSGRGGAIATYGSLELLGCTIVYNSAMAGSAIYAYGYVNLSGCAITNNWTLFDACALCLDSEGANLTNCMIVFQDAEAISCSSNVVLTCCNIYGNADGDWTGSIADQFGQNGNISEDPMFCSPPGNEDFTLHCLSPCAPGNHPDGYDCGLMGAWPVACGVTSTRETSWSVVKGLY